MQNVNWERLHSPDGEFRSAPFWAFNGKLEEEELRFQIRSMKEQGMGGFFIHSREGLETPYLSEEWMQAVAVAMDEARKQGLEVWIYDEDKWPSGSAGGLVSKRNPKEYSSKGLTLEVLTADAAAEKKEQGLLNVGEESDDGKILGIYTVMEKDGIIEELRQNLNPVGKGEKILVLRREISANSEWYNGFAPSDTLNPAAVREFLQLTHEAYKERFGQSFGGEIKGFFTDEPNCCDFYSVFSKGRPWVTWTDDLPAYFQEKRGYSLTEYLPYLFYKGEKSTKIRHDFWRTIAELFQQSYMKQLYEWCDKEGLESTGHILYENDLGYQARVCGAAMPQYAYLHRPGIDLLGEQTQEYLTVKQCTSVARQYGRKHTITETYGCTGWAFDFEGQKWLGDWQFVMGIDCRCQHLAQYSIAGCRKRDYPPVFSYQTTWWKYNHLLENYFARIAASMGDGETVCDVLVIHPMSSIWTKCGSSENENLDNIEMNMGWLDAHITSLNEWGDNWNRMAKVLLSAHIDFDFGDEILLQQKGSVENGALVMGCCRYHTVIVPGILSMFKSTRSLLEKFADAGGRILLVKPFPCMIEGEPVPALGESLKNLPNCRVAEGFEDIAKQIYDQGTLLRIKNKDGLEAGDILAYVKKENHAYTVFLVNNNREEAQMVMVDFAKSGKVISYNPWTDVHEEVVVQKGKDSSMKFLVPFTPAQSVILKILTDQEPKLGAVQFPYVHPHYTEPVLAALGPTARVHRTMENVLTLDTCKYRIRDEKMSAQMEVWQAQREIRGRLQMQQVYYNGAPQRYTWLNQPCASDDTPFILEFSFDVKDVPQSDCYVVIEKASNFVVELNHQPCTRAEGYFMDHQMCRFLLSKLEPGTQTLTISGKYRQEMELEDIYIIGDFAVSPDRKIVEESEEIHFGDWCLQGYYHYPGSLVYEFDFSCEKKEENKRYTLKMGDYTATLGVVVLNGETVGYLVGNTEDHLDLTQSIQTGENHLEIEMVGSPRNMFGPFHQTYTGCSRISWADFRTEGRFHTPAYVLKPYGIEGQITITES